LQKVLEVVKKFEMLALDWEAMGKIEREGDLEVKTCVL